MGSSRLTNGSLLLSDHGSEGLRRLYCIQALNRMGSLESHPDSSISVDYAQMLSRTAVAYAIGDVASRWRLPATVSALSELPLAGRDALLDEVVKVVLSQPFVAAPPPQLGDRNRSVGTTPCHARKINPRYT